MLDALPARRGAGGRAAGAAERQTISELDAKKPESMIPTFNRRDPGDARAAGDDVETGGTDHHASDEPRAAHAQPRQGAVAQLTGDRIGEHRDDSPETENPRQRGFLVGRIDLVDA